MHSVPYTLAHAAQLGSAPSHFDFLRRQAIQAVLTHRRFWMDGSPPLLDFFLAGGREESVKGRPEVNVACGLKPDRSGPSIILCHGSGLGYVERDQSRCWRIKRNVMESAGFSGHMQAKDLIDMDVTAIYFWGRRQSGACYPAVWVDDQTDQ